MDETGSSATTISYRTTAPVSSSPRRHENLALVFQEILTAIARLRSNRQAVSDSEAFRGHMRNALKTAESEGVRRGYQPEDVRQALFAVVGFLDESALNSNNAAFSDWARRPLQEEMFGGHFAGEVFFDNLEKSMGARESADLADLLEVHHLCLLMGYEGRYRISGREALRPLTEGVGDKIRRIRGGPGPLSPNWAPPSQTVAVTTGDPMAKTFLVVALACAGLALVLFVVFKVLLGLGASGLHALALQGRS
jgi:type VI secretion system protein ImpK